MHRMMGENWEKVGEDGSSKEEGEGGSYITREP